MSIAKLLEQHRALVDEAGRAAAFAPVKAAQISRPIELQEQRVERAQVPHCAPFCPGNREFAGIFAVG